MGSRKHSWYPVLGLALILAGCGGVTAQADSEVPEPPAVTPPTGAAPTVVPGPCPEPADTPATNGEYEFAPDANWARICGTSSAGTGVDPGLDDRVFNSPPDALVTNVAELIEYANSLPKATGDTACTMEFGPAYTLVVGYRDGTTQLVTGELYGCGAIGDRIGARELLNDFGNRLRAQRDAYPELAPDGADCADPAAGDFFVQPTLEQTTAAYVLANPKQEYVRKLNQITEWTQLRDEMLAASAPERTDSPSPDDGTTGFGPAVTIEAMNPQCEALTLQVSEGRVYWAEPGGQPMIWEPSEAAMAALQPYLEWADTVET